MTTTTRNKAKWNDRNTVNYLTFGHAAPSWYICTHGSDLVRLLPSCLSYLNHLPATSLGKDPDSIASIVTRAIAYLVWSQAI